MEVPIHLQYIILHTGIMYCMNLCHSKVVWRYYTGIKLIVGILVFGGRCPLRRNPTRPLKFGVQFCFWMGVWQNLKCHGLEGPVLIVPHLKMTSCFVQYCSRCPDVFLCIQMLLCHVSIIICYVLCFYCVADVLIFKNLCVYHLLREDLVVRLLLSLCGHFYWHCIMISLCGHPMFNMFSGLGFILMASLQPYLIRIVYR